LNDMSLIEPSAPQVIVERRSRVAPRRIHSWALGALLLLAVLATLHMTSDLVVPIISAALLYLVFVPAVRGMRKLHIPAPLGAGIIVFGVLAAFVGGIYNVAEPAGIWIEKAPQGLREIGRKLRLVTGSVSGFTSASDQVQTMTEDIANAGGKSKKVQEVVVRAPRLATLVVDAVREFSLSAVATLTLLYFLLASKDMILRKLIAATPRLLDKQRALVISQQIEAELSTYLFTVTAINTALGGAVALAMYGLGVPNPILWGVMVGALNFIPYLGDIVSVIALTVVGLLTFDSLWYSLSVPAVFYVLTAIEGYLVTPLILGRRLSLNPVVIVLSVLFWGWMWGVSGALLAVPILVVLKTVADHVASQKVVAEFLSA
jgi:predicted PurR-regulated permease PerM